MSRVFCRFRVQVIAVPLTVGQGNVNMLRLVRLTGRQSQQLKGLLLRKSHRQVPVEERESLLPRGVLARRDATGPGAIEESMHRAIFHR